MNKKRYDWVIAFRNAVIDYVIDEIEGGYSNDPDDSGGATKWGITKSTARRHGYYGRMDELPRELAVEIYIGAYWDSMKLDIVATYYPRAAYKIFDIGVNCGVARAGQFLQRLLNVLNNQEKYYQDLEVDGAVGQMTMSAFQSFVKLRGEAGQLVIYNGLNSMQGAFYISLAETREKDEKWAFGWLSTRVDRKGTVYFGVSDKRHSYSLNY